MQVLWVLRQEQAQSPWTPTLDGRAEQGLQPSLSFLCFPCQSGATCSLMSGQGLCGSRLSQTKVLRPGLEVRPAPGAWQHGGLRLPASSG